MRKKTERSKPKAARWEKRIDDTSYLTGTRRGAVLKEEVWYASREVVKYSLAYINPMVNRDDNGRVLGYDSSHGSHHRHFMGRVEEFRFTGYEALVARFEEEVQELWRKEDEEKRKA